MAFERKIVHYDNDATTVIQTLSLAGDSGGRVTNAWFELLRHGGCASGGFELLDKFTLRGDIEIGDFIAYEYEAGVRWYFGRVESVEETSPKGTRVQLHGLWAQMSEVFPGGFTGTGSFVPHKFANTDAFPNDPDFAQQSWDTVSQPEEIVPLLHSLYIAANTDITLGTVESPTPQVGLDSFIFRGEESAAEVVRMLASLMRFANFGVDEDRDLFVTQRSSSVLATFQEGVDCESLKQHTDRSLLFNRLLLTGGYVYSDGAPREPVSSGFFRYRANFRLTASVNTYGEKNFRAFVPWIRRNADAIHFAREFFREYGRPTTRHTFTTEPQTALLKPWLGQIAIKDAAGATMATKQFDKIRVQFDHAPVFSLTIGPEDIQFPTAPENQRYEICGDPAGCGDGEPPPSESITSSSVTPPASGSGSPPASSSGSPPASSSGSPASSSSSGSSGATPGSSSGASASSSGTVTSSSGPSSLLDGLDSSWDLDECASPNVDNIIGYNLTWSGTPSCGSGNPGSCLELDGTSDYASIPDNSTISVGDISFTISVWFKLDSFDANVYTVYAKGPGAVAEVQTEYQLDVRDTGPGTPDLRFIAGNGLTTMAQITKSSISTGTWYHAVCIHDKVGVGDGAEARMILNDGTPLRQIYGGGTYDSSGPLYIGRGVDGGRYFDGKIQGWSLWKRVLTESEITELYNGGSVLTYPF